MKNSGVLKRFILGSLVLALTIPLSYHVVLNAARDQQLEGFTRQLCKAIEPRIQVGALRDALETVQSAVRNLGLDEIPDVEMVDHGRHFTPESRRPGNSVRRSCAFDGISGVHVTIFYAPVPLANPVYFYIYLISAPLLFAFFYLARFGGIRLQKRAADRIEGQMRELLGMDNPTPRRTSFFDRAFDLELPLMKHLKAHIDSLEAGLASYSKKIAEQQKREILTDVAAQVAHDIVTPISTLQKVLSSEAASRDDGLVQSELARIKALSEKLLSQYRGATPRHELIALEEALTLAAEEIKAAYGPEIEVAVDFKVRSPLAIHGNPGEFAAAVANLLRNAVEAMDKSKQKISISLQEIGGNARIEISDNGCGIPEEVLPRIFDKGFTKGKTKGTGLGLYQAKDAVTGAGGHIEVRSRLGEGTTILMELPAVELASPVYDVVLTKNTRLVFLDDDSLIHRAWEIALRDMSLPAGMRRPIFFQRIGDFREWVRQNGKDNLIAFIDFNIDPKDLTGFDVIRELGLEASAYLFTGEDFDWKFRATARKAGVRVVEKSANNQIAFRVLAGEEKKPDLILIDDSRANQLGWKLEAERFKCSAVFFDSPEKFLEEAHEFSRSVPVFMDYFFEEGTPSGGEWAKKVLNLGFTRVYLATGYPTDLIVAPAGLSGIVGKEFPAAELGRR